jgi:hypothetical protein
VRTEVLLQQCSSLTILLSSLLLLLLRCVLLQRGGKFVAAIVSLLKWLRTCRLAGYFWSPVTAADFSQQPSDWDRYCHTVPADFRIDLGTIMANFERGEYGVQRGTGQ